MKVVDWWTGKTVEEVAMVLEEEIWGPGGRRAWDARPRSHGESSKAKAHRLVKEAVRRGEVSKKPCEVCGTSEGRVEAHHEDYAKPLDVVWLCKKHHVARHAELRKAR